jgi:hypothetical protein
MGRTNCTVHVKEASEMLAERLYLATIVGMFMLLALVIHLVAH